MSDLINKDDIEFQIQNTDDINQLKEIDNYFKMNRLKKELLRVDKLERLQDKLIDTTIDRVTKNSNYIGNRDLLEFWKSAQASVDRTQKVINELTEQATTPTTAIQNNTLNVNVNIEDKESRDRIQKAVQLLMNQVNNMEPVIIDKIEQDIAGTKERMNEEEQKIFLKGDE